MIKAILKEPEDNPRSQAIDDYISQWPEAVQERMNKTRELVHATVPDVTEKIGYAMPTFQWRGKNLCHFAGNKQHLGFYPGPVAIEANARELKDYKTSKGAIQFPFTEEMPYELMKKIILSAKENLEKIASAKKKK